MDKKMETSGKNDSGTEEETSPEKKEGVENTGNPKKPERTFTRDEVNKMIAAEKRKASEEAARERDEAERLSKMDEDERAQFERKKAEERAAKAEAELNAYRMKDTASKMAVEKGVPLPLLDLIDFHEADADRVKSSIEKMAAAFQKAIESGVNERLKQRPPETHSGGSLSPDFGERLKKAQESNDMTAIAYYSRMLAESKH